MELSQFSCTLSWSEVVGMWGEEISFFMLGIKIFQHCPCCEAENPMRWKISIFYLSGYSDRILG